MIVSMLLRTIVLILVSATLVASSLAQGPFVAARGHQFILDGRPHYFVGTNYWYGGLLGLEKDRKRGIERLRRELDFLKANGVTNLRIMAGAEGTGLLNGVERVGPPLQPAQGEFDESVLDGLDIVLVEMAKRKMHAVIFFSNNWEWSGGFQQYLIWNRVVPDKWLAAKPTWDELRDIVAQFYSCEACKVGYRKQADLIVKRTNKITKTKYVDDPTIFAWELANEPRPMRPAANEAYKKWIADAASHIRSIDKNHLITIGHEGRIGTESLRLFEEIHAGANIDYLTIHIWPKNWGWITGGDLKTGFANALDLSIKYIEENTTVAVRLNKPLVIEEFGLPRDAMSFDPGSPTSKRDEYYEKVLSSVRTIPHIAGANFWAFGGTARPITGQPFWKAGDERMGDPPMEEQGLNTVFDSDSSTWSIIRMASRRLRSR
ncbi:MAG TPA: cellulase family glycosylhydrolase [Pyrinomonadaceae bacterium]|nr:cellulase family glycosylhydrolase [Pyrinomonadaceae bacterium]